MRIEGANMITWMNCYCAFQGPAFSPRAFEEQYRLRFNESCEPGAAGTTGRYKGVPQPFGSAMLALKCDENGPEDDKTIGELARARADLALQRN